MVIAVYGASGHTARFVIAELLRRGHRPIAVGRDEGKLAAAAAFHRAAVETRVADLASPESLDRALAGVHAVINCAGPFLDTAEPVIEAALRARVHYLDVTAEQGSAIATLERFDSPARDRGVLLVPAAGFYGGLGDVLATSAMRDWTHADRVEIAIALDSWLPTLGTRRTGERNTAPRLVLSDGALTQLQPSAPAPWTFPDPFGTQDVVEIPFTETILMARHVRVPEIRNYLNQAPLRDLRDPASPTPIATDEHGRSNQQFLVDVVVRNGEDERRIVASGRDIYAVTAPIVVRAVESICATLRHRAGAFALAELVDASHFVDNLARTGVLTVAKDGIARLSA